MSGKLLWTDDLTDAQVKLIIDSGEQPNGTGGYGFELRGSGEWATARSLAKNGFGIIEGGQPNGSNLPGLYFNGPEALRVLHEFDYLDDAEDDEIEVMLWREGWA